MEFITICTWIIKMLGKVYCIHQQQQRRRRWRQPVISNWIKSMSLKENRGGFFLLHPLRCINNLWHLSRVMAFVLVPQSNCCVKYMILLLIRVIKKCPHENQLDEPEISTSIQSKWSAKLFSLNRFFAMMQSQKRWAFSVSLFPITSLHYNRE